ncbi:taste receptor type 2 member 9-like [Cuculus canorus]|uniref:taste receptor type 2 member 9-like n=1 Tax=Cuculus canorus TaxID=55661 RepID=UPI0023AA4AA3|nr:taste receptor type 2 member 9-like [Cuculus canorus]
MCHSGTAAANLHQALGQEPTFPAQHRSPSWRMEACYPQVKSNVTSHNAMAVVIISLQAFAGLWINVFIVSVLCVALVKKKTFNSNEKILLFLGCSRFGYFCFVWPVTFFLVLYPWLFYIHFLFQVLNAIHDFLNFSNLWVSSCLSIFYCIKIADFRYSFFTFLKANIDRIVPWLLMGSALSSLIIAIVFYKIVDELPYNNLNATSLGNFGKINVKTDAPFVHIFFISVFGYATAFLAVLFSALPLLFSLWRHKCRMQANSVRDVNVEAHIKAMKSILSFFFLYSINFIGSILSLIYFSAAENPMSLLVFVFELNFPTVHSLVLIFSNPKLEKTLLRTLLWVKCKVCGR